MKKNGNVSEAPKWSCGCEHHSMLEMKHLTREYIDYYTKSPDMCMYGLKCANKRCTHDIVSVKWPRPSRMSEYGYYCSYLLRDEWKENGERVCSFVICNDCATPRFEKENQMKMGSDTKRRSSRHQRSKK